MSVDTSVSIPRSTILIFDSGVGGLTIYREIRQRLPELHYIYLFDNAAFPYGEKSEIFIVQRVIDLLQTMLAHHAPALAVIACNTASTVALPALRSHFDFPIIGVVPAVKPAVKLTRNGIVGLLATNATIRHAYTLNLIAEFAGKSEIVTIGSTSLVQMAEALLRGQAVNISTIRDALQPWLNMDEPPDTVVLGCTHFPLLRDGLLEVLPHGTQLVDSGAAIARRANWLIENTVAPSVSFLPDCAYCTQIDGDAARLLPALRRYGFIELLNLTVDHGQA